MSRRRKTKQADWPKADWLEHQLAELGDLVSGARDKEDYSAAATLKKQMREVRREIDQLRDAAEASVLPESTDAHLVGLLKRTIQMGVQAQTAGSFVAASNLSKRELELVRELEEHRAKQEPEAPKLTLEQLVALLEQQIAGLPPVIRAKLKAKITT